MTERTAVYRMFGAEGVLLYIGVAKNFGKRWQQHAAAKDWWPQVQRQTVEWHPDRKEAERAEIEAIRAEKPRYNIAGVVRPKPARRMLPASTSTGIRYITQSDIARALKVSRHLLGNWCRQATFPVIEPDGRIHGAPLYRPERLDEIVSTIKVWRANRPGQGAGGGRPRRIREADKNA